MHNSQCIMHNLEMLWYSLLVIQSEKLQDNYEL